MQGLDFRDLEALGHLRPPLTLRLDLLELRITVMNSAYQLVDMKLFNAGTEVRNT